jgi:hypothetical protein
LVNSAVVVVAEAGVQGVELAFGGVVDAHLEDAVVGGLGRDGARGGTIRR